MPTTTADIDPLAIIFCRRAARQAVADTGRSRPHQLMGGMPTLTVDIEQLAYSPSDEAPVLAGFAQQFLELNPFGKLGVPATAVV